MSVQRLRSNKILGMAMTEQGILLAEIAVSGGKRELVKTAEFPYPGGTLPSDFTPIGRPLSVFLRQQGFSTRHAVIGLPARWVMVKPTDIPPADFNAAAKILNLQAETAFSSELKELVFDYSGQPDRNHPSTVLLMAVPKKRLEQIEEMATLARLTVHAIMPSVAALGSAMPSKVGQERLVVHIGSRAVELAAYHGSELERLRHVMTLAANVGKTEQFPAELGPELRRSIASMPLNGTRPEERRLLLWDELDHDESARRAFGARLGVGIDAPRLDSLGLTTTDQGSKYAAAVGLASMGLETTAPPVNFVKSRMIVADAKKPMRKYVWAGVALGLLLLLCAAVVYDNQLLSKKAADLTLQVAKEKPIAAVDQKEIDHIVFAKNWMYPAKRYQLCWSLVAKSFPLDRTVAFVKTVDLKTTVVPIDKKTSETMLTGTVTGYARDQSQVTTILDNLRRNANFKDVKSVNVVENGTGASRQVSFQFTFNFKGKE